MSVGLRRPVPARRVDVDHALASVRPAMVCPSVLRDSGAQIAVHVEVPVPAFQHVFDASGGVPQALDPLGLEHLHERAERTPIRLLQCIEVLGLLQCRDHRCQLRSPGEDVAHQQPCVRPFPSSNGWICMKRWFSPPADLRSVSNSSARLPSVGRPHSQRGDCAPVTVAAFNPLLPFSCSVVPGPFRAASACRARSSSLTTPCAGVSPPTTEFRRESGVDGSLIRRPAHLVRRTAGHGPTRACRRCDKTRAHRRHCQSAFGARHGSNP